MKTVSVSEDPSHSKGISETAEDVMTTLCREAIWVAASKTAIRIF